MVERSTGGDITLEGLVWRGGGDHGLEDPEGSWFMSALVAVPKVLFSFRSSYSIQPPCLII